MCPAWRVRADKFGDLTKATAAKIGAGVAAGVADFTGKEEYRFGDLTKSAAAKLGAGVAAGVAVSGDLTKATAAKIGAGVAAGRSLHTRARTA